MMDTEHEGPVGCDLLDSEEQASRYVAGTMSREEAESFEVHLVHCSSCREEVELAETIRSVLKEEGADGREPSAGSRRGSWPPWFRVAAAVALVGGLVVAGLAYMGESVQGYDELRRLGSVVQAPVYLGMAVRAPSDRPDSLFAEAMRAYAAGNYAAARSGLRSTIAAGGDKPPVRFFLGASLLMLDQPEAAAEEFEAVEAQGASPYVSEAQFYRAKALLRAGEGEAALTALRRAAQSGMRISGRAAALADSVSAILATDVSPER